MEVVSDTVMLPFSDMLQTSQHFKMAFSGSDLDAMVDMRGVMAAGNVSVPQAWLFFSQLK